MIMCEKTKEKFYNWLGMKLYNGSEQFKNVIYGIYYNDVQLPNIQKISDLMDENLALKTKINVYEAPIEVKTVEVKEEQKPKKRRNYTKRKKEIKE